MLDSKHQIDSNQNVQFSRCFEKIQMKKWSPSYSYSYQRPVNQQKPHYQMTKRQSQSNRKKIEHKTYFSNKGEKLLCILVCRKKNRTYKWILIVPGTYISIWIEETIAYSKLQDIFQRRNIILAHFGLWQEPNQICPVTQVYFVRVLTYLHLDLDSKDNRILESTTYFSIEEKSWFG